MILFGGKYCTIFIEFGIPMKLFRLVKTCFYNFRVFWNNSVSVRNISFLLHRVVCGFRHIKPSEFRFDSLQLSFLAKMSSFHRTGMIFWLDFLCCYLQLQSIPRSSLSCIVLTTVETIFLHDFHHEEFYACSYRQRAHPNNLLPVMLLFDFGVSKLLH